MTQKETGSSTVQIFSVPPLCEGLRLDQVIACVSSEISRSQAQKLIEERCVMLNGEQVKKRSVVHVGDTLHITLHHQIKTSLEPQEMDFSVLYEDESLFVINKPPGLVVHPACGHWEGTFAHGFLAHCDTVQSLDPIRPGIVHRLDKDTSGVLIAAKTAAAVKHVSEQFQKRGVRKEYAAFLVGEMKRPIDVDSPIGRHPKERKKMAILPSGKYALSHFVPLVCGRGLTYAKIFIETGRTHQIRVHALSIGFPVLGDSVYGNKSKNEQWGTKRQLLHCSEITLIHPVTSCEIVFQAPLPQDMKQILTGM